MPVMAATSAQVSCRTRTPTTRGRQGREIASREQIIPVVETRAGIGKIICDERGLDRRCRER
jgi:hypothetical protein